MEQTTTEWVAGQIRAILAQRQLSRRWLAQQLDIPLTTLSRTLRGDRPFTVDELTAVAKVLKVHPASLFPAEVAPVPATSGAA